MSYYFIVDTYIPEDGSGEYDDYITQVKPIVEQHGGKYLVRTNTVVSLNDGRCPQRSIVIEFPDHIGTGAYFQNKTKCKVYASAGEKRWIENIDLQFQERPIPNFYQLAGKSSVVDCVAADGDCIDLEEDFTVQVLSTPGHSADEISYIIDGSVFIGDTVPVKGDIPIYVNKEDTLESLRRLERLSAVHTFYPAWDKTYTREEMQVKISEARNLIGMLEAATAAVRTENPGENLEQIVQRVCEKVNRPQLMQNPLFKRTIKSHMKSGQIMGK